MKNFKTYGVKVNSVILAVLLSTSALAFDTNVETRTHANKLPTDNGIYFKFSFADWPNQFEYKIGERQSTDMSVTFGLWAENPYEAVMFKIQGASDLKPNTVFEYLSLDQIFYPFSIDHEIEIYLADHFVWVEAVASSVNSPANSLNFFAKRYSTVSFFGPGSGFVADQIAQNLPSTRYFNLAELKSDVKHNFANNFGLMVEMDRSAVALFITVL